MPQLDFNVAFINFLFLIFFIIFFFILFYYLIFQKLFKIIYIKKFLFENLENKKIFILNKKNFYQKINFLELKKILFFFKNIN